MTQEFIDNNNLAVAITFILRDMMEDSWVERSAFFNQQHVRKTLHTRTELNRILNKINNTQNADYVNDMTVFSQIIENFGRILLATHKLGKQDEFVLRMESIAVELGCAFLPEDLKKIS